jgi:excisionase family DNA binding protein
MWNELLSTREVAELLNVSPRTVTNWIRSDRVPYVRLPGGEYRIPQAGLLESLSGTYDVRAALNVRELEEGVRSRTLRDRGLTMGERLAQVARLSQQMTAIAGSARRG